MENNVRKICEHENNLVSLHPKDDQMEIKFDKEYLRELYYDGKAKDKKHRYQPQVVKGYVKALNIMDSVERVEDLFRYKSLHYEKLHGDKEGLNMGNLGYGFVPTHPGEVLKDELEARGISQRQLAHSMGMGYSVVNEILNGRRPLTAATALMFEAALDVPADSLMYLQTKYNMQTARCDKTILDRLKEIPRIAAVF